LVRPWICLYVEPTVWDIACTIPRKALPNAMPAIVAALCIVSRACGSFSLTDFSMLAKINLMAWSASPSVKSFAYTDTNASVACVRASIPESAATNEGIFWVRFGSTIATVGVSA